MYIDGKYLIGKSEDKELFINADKVNRHGLITGASGSGKTITLKVMAESFSESGIPVFLSDVKGDIAGTALPGEQSEKIDERLNKLGIKDSFTFKGFPTIFWDVYGASGHPIRTTVTEVGPQILSRMLGLSDAQEGVLAICFKIAAEKDLELVDLKDLRLLLQYIGENRKDYIMSYGNISTQSVGSIQRSVLMLEEQGGANLFGEPKFDINDFIKQDSNGKGNINILHAVELFKKPDLYACFMLWLLTTLNYKLPEVGDLEKPKMVFFFDEAHLLFDNMPSYMKDTVVQVVKLIRSKGIGLFFISQSPSDIPGEILSQLGNIVQHNLRAYTPAEQKAVKVISDSLRANPKFKTDEAILGLGTGEAIISFLNEKGEPGIVEKATILPPQSNMGAIDDSMRLMIINRSEFKGKYDTLIDRETAYEKIKEQMEAEQEEKDKEEEKKQKEKEEKEKEKEKKNKKPSQVEKMASRAASSAMSSIGRQIGNAIFKGLFGGKK